MGFLDHLMRDVRSILDRDGEQNAVPPLDGALSPNDRLDACVPIGEPLPGLDDVVADLDGSLLVSAGNRVMRLSGNGFATRTTVAEFDADAGGLAIHPDGRILVCVSDRGLAAIDAARPEPRWLKTAEGCALAGLISVAAAPDGRIFAVEGSMGRAPSEWRRDLMEKCHKGRLIECSAGLDNCRTLLKDLYYPYGIGLDPDGGQLWLGESWAHRITRMPLPGNGTQTETVLRNLPGYPARLKPDGHGGFYLGLFARRTHLIEFVLKEDDFRKEMIATMPADYWIAPAYAGGSDCLEPMQIGGVKALGIQKPWAPPRSYGLLVRLNANGEIAGSIHSRAGGRFHGITGACMTPQGLVIASRGAGRLLLEQGGLG